MHVISGNVYAKDSLLIYYICITGNMGHIHVQMQENIQYKLHSVDSSLPKERVDKQCTCMISCQFHTNVPFKV